MKSKNGKAAKTKKRVVEVKNTGGAFTLKVPGPLAKAITAKADGGSVTRLAINALKEKFA